MLLIPRHEQGEANLLHIRLTGATNPSSTSIAAAGTGLVYIPVYAWVCSSGVASVRYSNGTAGSVLFEIKTQAGGPWEIGFWEEPSKMSSAKAPVLETETDGIGVHDFHVWVMKVRGGAGQDGLGQ